jgi:hypothetical protein
MVEQLEGKRPLGSPKRRWEEYIKMDLKDQDKITRTGFFRIRTGKVVGSFKHGNKPPGSITCKQFLE